MSALAVQWVDTLDLRGRERLVMNYLARRVSKTRTILPINFTSLRRYLDVVSDTLTRIINRLVKKGHVRRHRDRRPDGTFGPVVLEICPAGDLSVVEEHIRDMKALARYERFRAVRASRAGESKRIVAKMMRSASTRSAIIEAYLEGVFHWFLRPETASIPGLNHPTFSAPQPPDVLASSQPCKNVRHIDTRGAGAFSSLESSGLTPSDWPGGGSPITLDDMDAAFGWSK